MNVALMVKWIWRLFTETSDSSLWHQIIRAKYPGSGNIFNSTANGGSPFWHILHKIKDYFKLGARFRLGNGKGFACGLISGLEIPLCAPALSVSSKLLPSQDVWSRRSSCREGGISVLEEHLDQRNRRVGWLYRKNSGSSRFLRTRTVCSGT
jgi:hypothetical protein